ncbi:hypothetical protein OQI87_08545 [Lactobacillus kefiranofaciens]|uniref:hypothetical protein n=1 Tax=Lactobacillus kefiranofaciens TaxID=267818 RepID=UPI002469A3AA|nr:hypothetical protein [Lactobacillus kefiranofaciens]MDH5101128.1 hypothetical protein [Lactobacillus kefiranofaciens]
MTQQFEKLTAEDLDCYRELFSGITRKIQRLGYSNFYIFNVQKTIHILQIYREWLLAQKERNFDKLYQNFWGRREMDITAVSLLLFPRVHDKQQELQEIKEVLTQIDELGTSYIFNDVQSNAIGLPIENQIYPANRQGLQDVYQLSKQKNNQEYCQNIQSFLNTYSEPYPDCDIMIDFFDNSSTEMNINTNSN